MRPITKPFQVGEMSDFPSLDYPVIIAFKGLPCVGKSHVAKLVARWASTPALFIEDFLTREAAPRSKEEAERHAFGVMCDVVRRQADYRFGFLSAVVLKSRICSTFESDQLMELVSRLGCFHALIIIELRCNNKFRRQEMFDKHFQFNRVSWYNLRNMDEVEKASDEYDAHAWDCHFDNSIAQLSDDVRHRVRRLVIDISSSITSIVGRSGKPYTTFKNVIRYLLMKEAMDALPNTVSFDEVQQVAQVHELRNAPSTREKYLCRGERGCVFKYRQALESDSCCGVCDKPISGSVYACYYCILVLHKSCAEEPKMIDASNPTPYQDVCDEGYTPMDRLYRFDGEYACDYCRGSGNSFSYGCRSCLLQTHLKCRVMPTIVKHACHPQHFLSIWLARPNLDFVSCLQPCEGCNNNCVFNGYVCVVCNYNYHIRCLATPREVKHKHGGYEHAIELMYSYGGMEAQEDFWCDACCKDINPAKWFYRCKECTYYSHMNSDFRIPCISR